MAINARPAKKTTLALDSFIAAAPDAAAEVVALGVKKDNKKQISVTIAPDLLARVDAIAASRGLARAAAFSVALGEWVEKAEANQRG